MSKQLKQFFSLFISVVMIFSMFAGINLSVSAENDILNYLTWEINDGEVTITGCDPLSISGDIVIPDTIEGYPVTGIGDCVVIHPCEYRSIRIPDSVTTISPKAFDNVKEMVIFVDDNNEFYSSEDGILFNKNKTELIKCCLGYSDYVVPDSVITIGDFAFAYCYFLESVTIGNSVEKIGEGAFNECQSLKSVTIGNSVRIIDCHSFDGCRSLTSITIPDNVITIGECAFSNCHSLESVTIGNGVETIGDGAFYECCITNLTLGKNVKSIKNIFDNKYYSMFKEITVDSENQYYSSEDGVLFDKDKTEIICYLSSNSRTEYEIPDSVMTIGEYAFSECHNLVNITIPNSVITIGECAFLGCVNLVNITIPDSVKIISEYAFDNCRNLVNVTIPDNVITIGEYAFAHCDSLESVIIGKNVETIGDGAFSHCHSLSIITIPASVTTIGNRAFLNSAYILYIYGMRTVLNSSCIGCITTGSIGHDINSNAMIYGYSGSTAEIYAKEKGINFVSLCEHYNTEIIDISDATCEEIGSLGNIYCTDCEQIVVLGDVIPAKGHTPEKIAGKVPTCTEKGLTDGEKCSVCGTVTIEQTEIPETTHMPEKINGKAPTCTEKGLTDGEKCSVCGTVTKEQKELSENEHSYGDEVVIQEATAVQPGFKGRVCGVCGDITDKKIIPPVEEEPDVPEIPDVLETPENPEENKPENDFFGMIRKFFERIVDFFKQIFDAFKSIFA